MLDIVDLYAVSLAGIFAVLLVCWAGHLATPYLPRLRVWTLRRIYPVLIRRRRWTSVTYMEFALLGVYAVVNGAIVGGVFKGLGVLETSNLMRRSGLMSSVNTVTLFLGGRTNVLIDAFGIPLHTYYLTHHWIGRMAVAQALLHSGLAISQGWASDAQTISGLVVAITLTLILLTSLYFIREILFELFLWAHMLLALTVIGGTIWHILPGEFISLFLPIFSISVWSIITVYRLVRICHNPGGYIVSYNSFSQPAPRLCAVKFTVRIRQHLDTGPGQYVYLYFSGLRRRYRFQAHPFMIVWCKYDVKDEDGRIIDITNLTFLVQQRGGLTARLARELRLSELSSSGSSFQSPVLFDGPYGQDLHLERYETVMLVANGIGIAGVLPYARHLAERNLHDREIKKSLKLASTPNKDDLRKALHRDATRKVDLFWKLELNRQEEWISEELRTLQDFDPGRRTNLIYCYYPEKKASEPLIKLDMGWKCIYPGDPQLTLDAVIEQEAGKSRRNIVVACGNATFTQSIRSQVLDIMSKDNIIEFAEVEYRPRGFRNQDEAESKSTRLLRKREHTRVTRLPNHSEEVELAQLPTREVRNVLSKAPGMQAMGKVYEDNHVENAARVRATAFV